MPHLDIGYFKKKTKRRNVSKSRNIENKFIAWKLDKEYYELMKSQKFMDLVGKV